jgi:hypothetical protein
MAGLQNATPSASRPTPSPSSAATSTSSKAGDASVSKGKASEAASSSHGDAAKPAKKVIRIDHQRKPGASKPNGKAVVEDGAVESDDEVEEIRTAGAARAEPVVPPSGVRPPNVTPEMLASVQEKLKDPNAMKVGEAQRITYAWAFPFVAFPKVCPETKGPHRKTTARCVMIFLALELRLFESR